MYNFYTAELEAKCKLEEEYKEVIANLANKEKSDVNVKTILVENKSLKEKLENKSLEFKQLKTDIENVHKDKNILSVALKASKADTKDQKKEFEKKSSELEKKVEELNALRNENCRRKRIETTEKKRTKKG